MKTKNDARDRAVQLRKSGYSLNEISSLLNVSKSSASLWSRGIRLSNNARHKLVEKSVIGRARARETLRMAKMKRLERARIEGTKVVRNVRLSRNETKLMCALLYWCEGEKLKNGGTLSFTNSDPNLMKTFISMLRDCFDVDESKLRLLVHIHDYHNAKTQLRFWSNVTNIPLEQCHRPYFKAHTRKRSRLGYQGCASVRYHDISLGRTLEAIAQEFMKGSIS